MEKVEGIVTGMRWRKKTERRKGEKEQKRQTEIEGRTKDWKRCGQEKEESKERKER